MSRPERIFDRAATRAAQDLPQQEILRKNLLSYERAHNAGRGRFANWQEARRRCHAIKAEAIAHLDAYLLQFEKRVGERGGHVFWAETPAEACDYIVTLAHRRGVRLAIKSKSMVSEEVGLTPALEAAGIEAVETDLGEYIVQLRHERPYHIVTPAMHLRREQVAELFHRKLNTPPGTETAEELAAVARVTLRGKFLSAGMGITGANFLIADEGLVAITENEGNARLSSSLPPVHVVLTGVEKILPRLTDLALFWPVLSTVGTGQPITCYNTLIGGPRRQGEVDGPEEFHVVLLDNGRTRVLADAERRDVLHCIRCGACLNLCPVFHTIGGHAYGTTYSGPIGAVLTPLLHGMEEFGHLSFASSLCGACTETCPVEIDLHHHLVRNRRDMAAKHLRPRGERRGAAFWRWAASDSRRFERSANLLRRLLRYKNAVVREGGRLDPLQSWTRQRAAGVTRFGQRNEEALMDANPSRKRILDRMRAALAERPLQAGDAAVDHATAPSAGGIFAPIENSLIRFQEECEINHTELRLVTAQNEAALLRELLAQDSPVPASGANPAILEPRVFVQDAPQLRRLIEGASISVRWSSAGPPQPSDLAGVTLAEALVARTGSILITSLNGGRAASVLPPLHVVYATASQLVNELAEAFGRVQESGRPRDVSMLSLITGPSRTSDIEKTLVMGAHGPRRVVVLLRLPDNT